jgi:pimeloyl-ACP methyl ester carboxylesterase
LRLYFKWIKFDNSQTHKGAKMDGTRQNQQIELSAGHALGYAEYGPPDGIPVFYFHGFPSSRLDWRLVVDDDLLQELNVRVIAPDRPGYGLSDFKSGRKMVGWPDDVLDLANALGIDRVAVLGISGGGPYAASCAAGIGDRLIKTGIVCGMGPADAPGMQEGGSWTLPGTPSLIRRVILTLTSMGIQRDPEQFISRSKETFSEPDRQLLDQPALADLFIDGMRDAFLHGIKGANHEADLYTRPWGFNLRDIQTQVHLWHGGQDLNVPISVGRYVAEIIPNCEARFYETEGHLTLPRNHIREILSTLTA